MVEYDEIGIWQEVKLAIIKDYASAYAKILDGTRRGKIPSIRWLYIGRALPRTAAPCAACRGSARAHAAGTCRRRPRKA
jgi:hypothetical protein